MLKKVFAFFLLLNISLFAVNNEIVIDNKVTYKQYFNPNETFIKEHIKETNEVIQAKLLSDKNEIKKRINGVAELLKETTQYNMSYKWGGNHSVPANTPTSIKDGMDCSGFITYVLYMHGIQYRGNSNEIQSPNAMGWHNLLSGLVAEAKLKGYEIRKLRPYQSENGWIYTIAYQNKPLTISHIGISVENQMAHARGGQKIEKTIAVTPLKEGRAGMSASFSLEDIIYFIANNRAFANSRGFFLTNMPSPEQIREDWSSIRKGDPKGIGAFDGGSTNTNPDEQYGDDSLSIAYQLFQLDFNFDEELFKPFMEFLQPLLDYTLPIAFSFACLFIIIRIMIEIIKLIVQGEREMKTIFFLILEKLMSALIVLTLIGFYKEIIYKPLLEIAILSLPDLLFGDQMANLKHIESGINASGNLTAIYYIATAPLARFVDLWVEYYYELQALSNVKEIITSFANVFEMIIKTLLMAFCCFVTIYLAVKFIMQIILAQVMLITTLAFAVFNLAISCIPNMQKFSQAPINAIVNTILRIIPVYIIMFVWITFADTIIELQIPTSMAILVTFVFFIIISVVWQIVNLIIKFLNPLVQEIINSVTSSGNQVA